MATIVRGHVPASEFALSESHAALPDIEFDVEQIIETGEETVMPLVWIRGADNKAVQEVLDSDPSVNDVELLSDLGDEQLYRMEWVEHVQLVLQMVTNSEATIIDAFGGGSSWYLRVLYPTRDLLSKTNEFCKANGVNFDIETIREMEGDPAGRYGLTENQYAALTQAVERGYYDIPRDNDLQALAEDFGVSHQALSERLRRGTKALVEDALLVGPRSKDKDT
ncbi:helix-turn-helix domain-containing protein [Halocatena marina]|uniref:Helix-turn-helix domain-containing protein n=1 Tax=Halocatena marina TaxID=2934937 RepID=A0ABD5YJ13_9EURY|nr:helix-turn-helix domain-containing protein [Halocatena marina]